MFAGDWEKAAAARVSCDSRPQHSDEFRDGGHVRPAMGRVRHLGKQAAASTCLGARAGLLKISTCLAQTCALSCLHMADGDATLLTASGCNGFPRFITGSVCLCELVDC